MENQNEVSLEAQAKTTTQTPPRKTPTTEKCEAEPASIKSLYDELMEKHRAGAFNSPAKNFPSAQDVERSRNWERREKWRKLISERGDRYDECRLENFDCQTPSQTRAVEALTKYAARCDSAISEGQGVIIFGAKGTGKDHLAMGLCRAIIRADYDVSWLNGMDFFGAIRDRMDSSESEKLFIDRYVRPKVLYISDPIPPFGVLTEFQSLMLFRVLDARYSRLRPCIVTVNVSKGSELDQRIGPQNGDRIRDGALAIHCDWPSHRKTKQ